MALYSGGRELLIEDDNRYALANGYKLNEYCIQKVLGHGGFGITYLAHDQRLDRKVAIKEFMPADLAAREAGSTVIPRSPTVEQDYNWGLDRFLKEARTLAQFSHANIVRVLTLFEANKTAYIVMCYEEGVSLGDHLKARGGTIPASELAAIAEPLLDGLDAVHKAGFLHRDIKPSNIFLRANGTPILLDFGTARQTIGNISRSMASVLTPGYAPIEQYTAQGRQGEWTDIYGMGAVLYTCISGRAPPEAPARIEAHAAKEPDPLKPAAVIGRGRYPAPFLKAIDRSLALLAKDRLQSVAELRQTLLTSMPPPLEDGKLQTETVTPVVSRPTGKWPALAAGASAVLLAIAAMVAVLMEPDKRTAAIDKPGFDVPADPVAPDGQQDEATMSTAREAIQVSTVYGRQTYRRLRQQEALPSLERLAKTNTRYQQQLDDVLQGIQHLDKETDSLLRQYTDLVDKLARSPSRFEGIKQRLATMDLTEAGRLARQHLIDHVEAKERGTSDTHEWEASLDRSYSVRDLW
ncbi:MAG TPA: serine/threonine-protein kinase [Skermanella sp.]|nr:serine/threonine-protein kinase [Skermanella sp.]